MYVAVPVTGSSPLVRGQPATDNVAAGDVRIIPARAGPTYITVDFDRASTDHPRSCGANVLSRLRWRGHFGSSPLVRGQPFCAGANIRYTRIIPARAGPTLYRSMSSRYLRGSSPLVRGQLCMSCDFHETPRIIPARAGPTSAYTNARHYWSDHPRSCGANLWSIVFLSAVAGSSPLVRGQPTVIRCKHTTGRIIPARAGPTG